MSTTITTTPTKRKRKPTSSRRLFGTASTNRKRPRTMMVQRQTVKIGKGPCPPKTVAILKYAQTFSSIGVAMDVRFRLNSIFSPDATGAGHQPLGRDQYAVFYNRYRVLKCKVTVIATPIFGITKPWKLIVVPDNITTTYTLPDTALEQQNAVVLQGTKNGQFAGVKYVKTYYPHLITGVNKKEYQDDRFQAVFGSNPAEDIILHLVVANGDNTYPASGDVNFTYLAEYTVEMFDPLQIGAS